MFYHWATKTLRWAISITKFIWHASCILLNFENLTYFRWKALKHLEHSPRKNDTFTVYTFEGLQFIFYKDEFKEWLIKNLRRNVLSIDGMVFSNISNAKWKQKYGANSDPQISLRFQFSAKTV